MEGGYHQEDRYPRRRKNVPLGLHAEISVRVVNGREGIKD